MAYIYRAVLKENESDTMATLRDFATESEANHYLLSEKNNRFSFKEIDKVPATYTLLCIDQSTFEFPTDFLGNFDSLADAVNFISDMLLSEARNWDSIDRFNETPKFEVLLSEYSSPVDYMNNLVWYLSVSDDGKQVIAEQAHSEHVVQEDNYPARTL